MHDFRFAQAEYLLLLLALPALALLLRRFRRGAMAKLRLLMAEENLRKLLQTRKGLKEKGRQGAFWSALLCLVLALARPQANPQIETLTGASMDIYVLLDVSKSMDAEDIPPSRLKKAKRTVQYLTELLSGDRLGVIAFAGSSVLLSPLTADYEIVKTLLQNVDTSTISGQGTNLLGALQVAKEAMARGAESVGEENRSNVFLILSDGEDQENPDLEIVEEIREQGGIIFSIAIGTEKGALLPVRNEKGELLAHKRDRAGNPVLSKVNPKLLQEVAERGGGQFYFATTDEGEVRDILARLQDRQRSSAALVKATVYEELFLPFVLVAFLLLLFCFSPLGRFTPKKKAASLLALLLSLPAQASPLEIFWDAQRKAAETSHELALQGKPAEAADRLKELLAENPDSPELNYNIGTYLIEDKKYEPGREQLARLLDKNNPQRPLALHNVAGSYALEGKKAEARANYSSVIRELGKKTSLSESEQQVLESARKNLARLADPKQDPQNQQNQEEKKEEGDQQGKDGKPKESDKSEDGKDQKDGKSGDEKKDQEGEKPEDKENKEDQKEGKDQEGKDGKKEEEEKQKLPPKRGKQPFKERDNLSEGDAKQILETLKQREGVLQKKFLQKQGAAGSEENEHDKDW